MSYVLPIQEQYNLNSHFLTSVGTMHSSSGRRSYALVLVWGYQWNGKADLLLYNDPSGPRPYFSGVRPKIRNRGRSATPDVGHRTMHALVYSSEWEVEWVAPSTSSKKQLYVIRSLPSTMMQQLPFGWPAGVRRPSNKHPWH
uniref:Uncharacterized protein n=1 Tax=Ixodes ricinus TaxID=34613 RepID=A0A0K8R3Q2_IXORI